MIFNNIEQVSQRYIIIKLPTYMGRITKETIIDGDQDWIRFDLI